MSGCLRFEAYLAGHAVGVLTPEQQLGLEGHLVSCASCLEVARQLGSEGVADALIDVGGLPEQDDDELRVVDPSVYARGAEIGRGGMGRIVRARDRRLGRAVAIKELLDGELGERFEREARLTARLEHPAIVSVHEAGRWPSGEPFYAMRYVAGRPLHELVAERATLAERLELLPNLITAVEAIAYAHSERVVHRDVKPHNILIGDFGETVVIDWGLAKDLSDVAQEQSGDAPYRDAGELTRAGAGTPLYMSPEQSEGRAPDERMDVYGLGATLYHLLAGAPAFAKLGRAEVGRARLSGAPPLAGVAPELAAIVTRAMAPSAGARYASAGELAEELRRFQTGRLVDAHNYTTGELVRRWMARHRALLAACAVFGVVLAVVGGVAVARVIAARREAERQNAHLLYERGREQLLGGQPAEALAYLEASIARGEDTPALRRLVGSALDALDARVVTPEAPVPGDVKIALAPDGTAFVRASGAPSSDRAIEIVDTDGLAVGARAAGAAALVVWAADARHVVVLDGAEGAVWFTREASGRWAQRTLPVPAHVDSAALSPDGGLLLVAPETGAWQIIDARSGAPVRELPRDIGRIRATALDSDGRAALAGGLGMTIFGPEGERLPLYEFDETFIAFDRERGRLVTSNGAIVRFWDVRDGHLLSLLQPSRNVFPWTTAVRLSADGNLALVYGTAAPPTLWEISTGTLVTTFAQEGETLSAEFVGADVVTVGKQGMVHRFSAGGVELARFDTQRTLVAAALDPRGDLVLVDPAGGVVTWVPDARVLGPIGTGAPGVRFADEDRALMVSAIDGSVQLWDRDGTLVAGLPWAGKPSVTHRAAAMDPHGQVVVCEDGGRIVRWDPATDTVEQLADRPSAHSRCAVSPSGRVVVQSDFTEETAGRVTLRTPNPSELRVLDAHGGLLVRVAGDMHGDPAISDDGRMVATVEQGVVVVFDATTGVERDRVVGPPDWNPQHLIFSSDGRLLLVDDGLGNVVLRHDGQTDLELQQAMRSASFARDGSGALVHLDGTVTLLDAHGRRSSVRAWGERFSVAVPSADGRWLATGSVDGTTTVWDVARSEPVLRRRFHDRIHQLTWSPDGATLLVEDSTATWIWPVNGDPRPPAEIRRSIRERLALILDGDRLTHVELAPFASSAPRRERHPDAIAFACPAGDFRRGAPWPAQRMAWCIDPQGRLDGMYFEWYADGTPLAFGTRRHQQRVSLWGAWKRHGELLASGDYDLLGE